MLAGERAAVEPQGPVTVDMCRSGCAGDGTEDGFRNEVDYLDTLASDRPDARGVVTLVNHFDSLTSAPRPLATLDNLRIPLAGAGDAPDRDEDLLLMHLTMLATADHKRAARFPPLQAGWITPDTTAGVRGRRM